jgi:hypothetical protein
MEVDAFLGHQEGVFLSDHRLSLSEVDRDDLAGEVAAEGGYGPIDGGCVVDHEKRLAGDDPAEGAEQAATAQVGVHGDAVAHPGKRADLRVKGLTAAQAQGDRLHDRADDLIIGAAEGAPGEGHHRIG